MKYLLYMTALACMQPNMINKTKYPWNQHDRETMRYCQKRCPQIYEDSPCLSRFIKFGKQDYHCICGQENKT